MGISWHSRTRSTPGGPSALHQDPLPPFNPVELALYQDPLPPLYPVELALHQDPLPPFNPVERVGVTPNRHSNSHLSQTKQKRKDVDNLVTLLRLSVYLVIKTR